ncbi:MAG: hypothetical protein R2726_20930 [Acidimicrobiales bacterium]
MSDPSTARRMLVGASVALAASAAIAVLPAGAEVGTARAEVAGSATPGAAVVVSGSCAHQTSGSVSSPALASAGLFATDQVGAFTVSVTASPAAEPGPHPVTVRCGGDAAAATTTIVVVG